MLMNYVTLEKDVPTRLHFSDHYEVTREIWDSKLKKYKTVKSLVFWVDELNGAPTARTFSVLSENLASILRPYLPDHTYAQNDFIITKRGEEFGTKYDVQPVPKT